MTDFDARNFIWVGRQWVDDGWLCTWTCPWCGAGREYKIRPEDIGAEVWLLPCDSCDAAV